MLRKIRITLATMFFMGLTLLFLDFTGTLHHWLGWMAKVQFLPAVLALNFVMIAVLVLLTLVFGRIYCSVICPLGVLIDGLTHLRRKRNRFTYSKEMKWLRYTMVVVFIVSLVLGAGTIAQLIAPYSSFGRIVTMLLQPLWQLGNNVLAFIAERADSYAFYSVDVWIKSLPVFIIAIATLVVLSVLAWRGGRTYCNTVCPVGTVLSLLARFSYLKIRFDKEKCRNCSLCTKNCKVSCIDYKTHTVDYSRCVVCGNCITKCKFGALSLSPTPSPKERGADYSQGQKSAQEQTKHPSPGEGQGVGSRRSFLLASAMVTTAALAQDQLVDGGMAIIKAKQAPKRNTLLTPPGSQSYKNFAKRCTGCQLCVSQCPNGVLRPSLQPLHLMLPEMSYEKGFCRPECTRCSEVCPTGSIKLIDQVEKTSIQIGHAIVSVKECISAKGEDECGNCSRHCPAGAITMVPSDPNDDLSPSVPAINESACIGCGACEYVCPVRPLSAIRVEGHEKHRHI